jgi:hypothetical protein
MDLGNFIITNFCVIGEALPLVPVRAESADSVYGPCRQMLYRRHSSSRCRRGP